MIKVAQTNKGMRPLWIPSTRIFRTVEIKLIAPRIEEMPAKCSEKIPRSTEGPAWARFAASGGYTVHPVPTPLSTKAEARSKDKAGGSSQNLKLFNRGKDMSGAPSIKGRSQFPNPPIAIGITKKKIITNAWAVTITLYSWSEPRKGPG